MPVRGLGPTCVVHGCMKPVRELGGYCFAHFAALSPMQRHHLQWLDIHEREGGDTVPIPAREIREVCELEDLWEAPAFGEAA